MKHNSVSSHSSYSKAAVVGVASLNILRTNAFYATLAKSQSPSRCTGGCTNLFLLDIMSLLSSSCPVTWIEMPVLRNELVNQCRFVNSYKHFGGCFCVFLKSPTRRWEPYIQVLSHLHGVTPPKLRTLTHPVPLITLYFYSPLSMSYLYFTP